MRTLIITLCASLLFTVWGAEPKLPRDVLQAEAQYADALTAASAAYEQAKKEAVAAYTAALDAEIIKATRDGNNALLVDLVNRKQQALDGAEVQAAEEKQEAEEMEEPPIKYRGRGYYQVVDEMRLVSMLSKLTRQEWEQLRAPTFTVDAQKETTIPGARKGSRYMLVPHPEDTWQRNEFPASNWQGNNDPGAALSYQSGTKPKTSVASDPIVDVEGRVMVGMKQYGARSSGAVRVKVLRIIKPRKR